MNKINQIFSCLELMTHFNWLHFSKCNQEDLSLLSQTLRRAFRHEIRQKVNHKFLFPEIINALDFRRWYPVFSVDESIVLYRKYLLSVPNDFAVMKQYAEYLIIHAPGPVGANDWEQEGYDLLQRIEQKLPFQPQDFFETFEQTLPAQDLDQNQIRQLFQSVMQIQTENDAVTNEERQALLDLKFELMKLSVEYTSDAERKTKNQNALTHYLINANKDFPIPIT